MGKGRDRGARGPIEPITPTFVLPRQGEGIGELVAFLISRALAQPQPQFSKEIAQHVLSTPKGSTEFKKYEMNKSFVLL
jgi:hypothetical protein